MKGRTRNVNGLTYPNVLLMLVSQIPVKDIAWSLDCPAQVIEAIKVRMSEEYALANTVFVNSCLIGMTKDQQEIAEHLLRSSFNANLE